MHSPQQLKIARIVVLVTWLFALSSFFFPVYYSSVGGFGRTLFWLLACVHLVEFGLFFKLYQSTGESLFGHFAKTMVYGVIHKTEVEQRVADA
jgi:uncharacterized protein YhhL (DUF1145 family)